MQFDFVSAFYDPLAQVVFGNTLEEAKVSLLGEVNNCTKVLIIGGGTGSSLMYLLNHKNGLQVDFVESSLKMITKANVNTKSPGNVNFIHSHFENYMGSNYDFIITEFFFDLFEDQKINSYIHQIKNGLNSNGKWINTDFKNVSPIRYRFLLKAMYLFFRLTSNVKAQFLIHLDAHLKNYNFKIQKEQIFNNGFISSQLISQF